MIDFSEISDFACDQKGRLWRVSRSKFDPMVPTPRALQGRGRYDDPLIDSLDEPAGYSVLYAAESARGAFLEVLFRFRPNLADVNTFAAQLVTDTSERDSFLKASRTIDSDFLSSSRLTSAKISTRLPVFDLTNPAAVQGMRELLAPSLIALGLNDLDFAQVLGSSRQLTQAISRWIWSLSEDGLPLFSGIRYRSRFDPECICIALYEHRYTVDGGIDIQPITPNTPGFAEAANTLRLQIA